MSLRERDAIAVIGMACRLPSASNPDRFWELLREGRDAIIDTPSERWAMYGLAGPDESTQGLRRGGYLDGVERFDAGFFGIGPREAAKMDPQQRLMLELSWEALEDAQLRPADLADDPTGVYVGAIADDYAGLLRRGDVTRQAFTGTQRAIIANRVSYFLGLRGPSLVVDSGQSSGLVAVHLACESLRSGESAVALAGGVNLNVGPGTAIDLSAFGALSPDGRCFTLDARANGFVRGEGAGVVLLKPLEAAVAAGDPVVCVIRGSALNNDGGGDGLTAPAAEAQARVLRDAYERAGVAPQEVLYVELHGTGTPLGDRAEATALGQVLGARRPADRLLRVGSAKTNIGHLEGAAGIAGLIKAALCVQHRELPPSLNFERPTLPLDELGLQVQTVHEPWPENAPGLAGVSSFGIGGTNCHVVLETAPEAAAVTVSPTCALFTDPPLPLVVSAAAPAALREGEERLAAQIATGKDRREDVGFSLATTRAALPHRAVLLGDAPDRVAEGVIEPDLGSAPVFVFPGQGGQWAGMGVELLDRSPVFAEALRACAGALAPHVDFDLEAVLRGAREEPAVLEPVQVVQPTLFAVMVSLAALWRSAGVTPVAVVGHSQGEIAAAHVAGGLSLKDAARIVAVRSRALARIEGGGLAAVALTVDALEARAAGLGIDMTLGAVNSPSSLIVSGTADDLDALVDSCEADNIRARRIAVSYAAHSPAVEVVREELLAGLEGITPRAATVPFYSTVTGAPVAMEAMDPAYWFRNLRETVQYAGAVQALIGDGHRSFVEVSPHPVLTLPTEQTAEDVLGEPGRIAATATLRRDEGGPERFVGAAGELWVRGGEVDWAAVFAPTAPRRVKLPGYAFQRERHWTDAEPVPAARTIAADDLEVVATDEGSFAARLSALSTPERRRTALDLVLREVTAVLGHASTSDVGAQRPFKELGFDSPAAVELRNRLNRATGLRLPATLLFDHPTPTRLAERLVADATGTGSQADTADAPRLVNEPIAIVGIGCRYPGNVRSASDLWDLVIEGRDAIGPFPTDRGWDLERLHDPAGERQGTTYVRNGGFLYDAGDFDADHFSISPREALSMDPHQRLVLECSWEALEDAGIDPLTLRGSATGVFAGIYGLDYGPRMHDAGPSTAGYALTGTLPSVVTGRVAYTFGLEGPAVSVDTACSSSLVALHLACQALRSGECDLALAGGATVMASPGIFVDFSRQRGLSPDGRCRAYGVGADGTGFSEGVGMLVLTPLSVARERGLDVLGLVRASAINQDGASNGLTAPSGPAQARVIRQALGRAGLGPEDVDAVEGHGTGTELGDPIEAGALLATYGRHRSGAPLYLGSLKSNIGHTQAAAGVGGVIKMVMALRNGMLPPTLYADAPSPHVDWEAGSVKLLIEPTAWPERDRPRRAGVSSFGISGTNAHLVLEQAPAAEQVEAVTAPDRPELLPFLLSGTSDAALQAQLSQFRVFVEAQDGEHDAFTTARSLALGRAHLSHRAVILAANREQLVQRLAAVERGAGVVGVLRGRARDQRRVGFVFPGQGGQWDGMAVALLEESPVFRERMEACAAALAPHVEYDPLGVLRGEPGQPSLEAIEVVQPVLFAIMVSLAALWRAYGVEPVAVVGHSQGEIAAAHVAGGLSLQDAARVVAVRSQELAQIEGGGGMMAVSMPKAEFESRAAAFDGRVTVAAVNGPASLVASGDPAALDELQGGLEQDGIRFRRIASTVAGHSPHVEVARAAMLERLAGVAPSPGSIPLYSTVTTEVEAIEGMGAEHWYRNLRQTVLFEPAVRKLAAAGVDTLIEIGPHPVLAMPALEVLESFGDASAATVLSTLHRGEGGMERFLAALGEAHTHGVQIDWSSLFPGAGRVPLPTYAFQRRRYWLDPGERAQDATTMGQTAAEHPLLGARVPLAGGGVLLTGRLSVESQPWLADQAEMGSVVFPGTAFLELALHAGGQVDCGLVDELVLAAPLVVEHGASVLLQVALAAPADDGSREIVIHSRLQDAADDAPWTEHAAGRLEAAGAVVPGPTVDWPAAAEEVEPDPLFPALRRVGLADGVIHAEVTLVDEGARASDFELHPALLDAALRGALAATGSANEEVPLQPVLFRGVRLHASGATSVRLELRRDGGDSYGASIADAHGTVATFEQVRFEPMPPAAGSAAAKVGAHPLLRVGWVAVTPSAGEASPYTVLDLRAVQGQDAAAVHEAVGDALCDVQRWVADPAGGRLAVLTRGAIAVHVGERPALAARAVWGLLRSARSEHPDRFALVDVDGDEVSLAAVTSAVGIGEPQVAIRGGEAFVARLERVAAAPEPTTRGAWTGTVLITGGTSGLGAATARHLVEQHGVRRLLLVSRSGAAAPAAGELERDLRALGAEVTIAACDVADRDKVRRLLEGLPEEHSLTGVVHCAMVLDDATVASMTREQVDAVLRAKLDSALHLHELTRVFDLRAFVLCSSLTSEFGSPGQGNYSAANACLSALAELRRADGLPAIAVAYGLLGETRDPSGALRNENAAQVLRQLTGSDALGPLSDKLALDYLDRVLEAGGPTLVATPFDRRVLARECAAGTAPPLLSGLLPIRPRRSPAAGAPVTDSGAPAARPADLSAAMRDEIATALGYASAEALDMNLSFLELGVDSLLALELRNRLQALTGQTLSTTLVYEHRSPADLIAHLGPGPSETTASAAPAAANGNGAAPSGHGETLTALFRRAQGLGRPLDGVAILEATARLRPRFGLSHAEHEVPPVHVLARNDDGPVLCCVPSVIATGGPHEFARLARSFAGRPEVVAVEHRGFQPHAALPSTVEAAAAAQAVAIRRHANGRPVVLVGFSTGGLLAYAAAVQGALHGVEVGAVVLVDAYAVEPSIELFLGRVVDRMLSPDRAQPDVTDHTLMAMATYLRALQGWRPPRAVAPTLLVAGSAEPSGGPDVWWPHHDALVTVPADHLSILEDHADATATAIEAWLGSLRVRRRRLSRLVNLARA